MRSAIFIGSSATLFNHEDHEEIEGHEDEIPKLLFVNVDPFVVFVVSLR
jgi:hypothetical protein